MNSYRITHAAGQDLDDIFDYLAESSHEVAGRALQRFITAFRRLAEFPGIGHHRADLTDHPFLFWTVGPYLVLYLVTDGIVEIVRVLHASRDVSALLYEEPHAG